MDRQLREICRDLRNRLGEAELTPRRIAAERGISLRYLHKLFMRRGTSFGRWLMEARLAEARRWIEADGGRRFTLQEIAFACGFSTQAHFSARYRARYGQPPSAHRRGTLGAAQAVSRRSIRAGRSATESIT